MEGLPRMLPRIIPTGNTSEIAQAYYNYLYSYYYAKIPVNRATTLHWQVTVEIFMWGLALIITFFLLTYLMYYTHRDRDELYEATSFAGSLLERGGKVDMLTWAIFFGLFIAAIYLSLKWIYQGYLY